MMLQVMQLKISEDYNVGDFGIKQDLNNYDRELQKWVMNFFKQTAEGIKLPHLTKKKQYSKNDHKFLVVFDNVEDLIEHDGDNFCNLLSKFVTQCERVSVVLVSVRPLGILYNSEHVKTQHIFLDHLKPRQAVELFIDQSKDIFEDELLDLVLANPKNCIEKLLPGVKEITEPLSAAQHKRIMAVLRNYDTRIDVLAAHDFFVQLSGNPLSISILSSFHRLEHMKGNDLTSIYRRLCCNKDEETSDKNDQGKSLS